MIIDNSILALRWYRPPDLAQLTALYRDCFPDERWTEDDFHKFMCTEHNNVIKVLVDDEDVVYGSLLYTMDTQMCRIRRVAVSQVYRRIGLCTFMLHALCGPRSPIRRSLFTVRVRETNTPMLMLLKNRMGFVFDPRKPRQVDVNGVEFYEFTFTKECVVETAKA